jgi:alkaline phosphatase D
MRSPARWPLRSALTALLGAQGIPYDAVKASFSPYIDLNAPPVGLEALFGAYRLVLTGVLTVAYVQEGLSAADAAAKAAGKISGNLDATVVNALLFSYNADPATSPKLPLLDAALLATLDRGIPFAILGKTALFSSLGSRYFVVKPTFDLYAAYRTLLLRDPQAENAYGDAQLQWLESALKQTDARWKVVVNSTSLTSMILDLTGEAPGLPQAIKDLLAQLPAQLRNRFYLDVDQFDGSPNFRSRLLQLYGSLSDVALVAGDIHAAFATEHAGGVREFTGPAISSSVIRGGIQSSVQSDPILSQVPSLGALLAQLDVLLAAANAEIRYVNTAVNGIVVLEASSSKLAATCYQLDGAEATTSPYTRPWKLLGKLTSKRLEVRSDTLADADAVRAAERVV